MFPIAAQFAREATRERARSALPEAPVRRPSDTPARPRPVAVASRQLPCGAPRIGSSLSPTRES
jgi:hypothetical protein